MAEPAVWIVNASPTILLARIGQLAWLENLADTLWVPEQVIEEVSAGRNFDPTAATAAEWATRYRIANIEVPTSVRAWNVDPGESQVIAHALRLRTYAVLDDAAARRCALALGLPVFGSIGVVLRAKQAGLIPKAEPWVEKLRDAGMFADERLIRAALASIGE
jgi:predicted nucleic acid-binding protein